MSDLLQTEHPARASIDAKDFSTAMKKVSEVLAKSAVPVLSEVLVRFSGGRCIITGTDLNTWIISKLPARGDDFAFVFSRTKDVERACRYFDGCLTLEQTERGTPENSGGLVTLSCGPKAGEFETYHAEDYPAVPESTGEASFSTNAAVLLERIGRVAYATKKPGQSAKEFTSCVEFSGSQVFAIDGQRAAWDMDSTLTFPQPFLVCAEDLRLLKLFGNAQVDLCLAFPRLYGTDGSTTIIFRMTEGVPFDLCSAIPKRYAEEFSVSPKKVLGELKYLSDATPRTRTPRVCLRGDELFVTVNGRKYSTAIDAGRQNAQNIVFELRHMTDAFKQFEKEPQVKVKISGDKTPVVIEAEGRSDCALMLPVRLKENAAA